MIKRDNTFFKNLYRFIRAYWRDCLGVAAIGTVSLALITIRYISYFAIM